MLAHVYILFRFRDYEFAEQVTEPPIVAEARNVFISQEPNHHSPYYDDDEFSDTDSFDSSNDDDDEEHAVSSSRPDSNSSLKSEYGRGSNFPTMHTYLIIYLQAHYKYYERASGK